MPHRNPIIALLFAALLFAGLAGPTFLEHARADDTPPVKRAEIVNAAVLANADALATAIGPISTTPTVAYQITVGLITTDSVFNVKVMKAGSTTRTYSLNSGTALVAGQLYTFQFGATSSCTYNFTCTTGTTIGLLLVEEIRGGGR